MGETPCHGCPLTGPCCLDVRDTVILLVALSLAVQLGLKIVMVICCRLRTLLGGLGGLFVPEAPPPPDPPIQKPRCPTHDLSPMSPRDRRPTAWGLPLLRRCPLCPWEPVQLTMDINLHRDPARHEHEASQDTPRPRHNAPGPYQNCTCPRASSAPSALPQDAGRSKPRPATVSRGTDARPAPGVRFGCASREQLASSGANSQRQRPTKVYIYPVHPETPPASRDPSPGRRELRWKEDAERPAGGAGQSRDAATDTADGAAGKLAPPGGRAQYYKGQEPSMQDWVYRPVKEPQWDWNQVG